MDYAQQFDTGEHPCVILVYIALCEEKIGEGKKETRRVSNFRMNQTDLVARLQVLGVNLERSGLSKIETGERPISDIEIKAIAGALKLTVAWLFGETESD